MNRTPDGKICQAWSGTDFTEEGKHNYCRNPDNDPDGVWCYTNYPYDRDKDYCSVPKCPKLKVLDLSADNDNEPDSNG